MRRPIFYILLSLAERDRHGSSIMRDVLELTDGELRLWPVTLYGSLEEMREEDLIRGIDAPAEPPDGEMESGRTRWFRITPAGHRALASEVSRMESLARVAKRRLAHIGESR